MALDDDVRTLSGVELFSGFTQDQLRLLAFGAENMHLAAHRNLYREGDQADSAFVVVRGRVDLLRDRGEEPVVVGEAGAGAILSELALIADSNRMSDAVTATETDLIRLERKLFRRILEEYPDLAVELHDRIVARMQTMVADIERLAPRFAG
jgi:CRP-like cAMP-binding protein